MDDEDDLDGSSSSGDEFEDTTATPVARQATGTTPNAAQPTNQSPLVVNTAPASSTADEQEKQEEEDDDDVTSSSGDEFEDSATTPVANPAPQVGSNPALTTETEPIGESDEDQFDDFDGSSESGDFEDTATTPAAKLPPQVDTKPVTLAVDTTPAPAPIDESKEDAQDVSEPVAENPTTNESEEHISLGFSDSESGEFGDTVETPVVQRTADSPTSDPNVNGGDDDDSELF